MDATLHQAALRGIEIEYVDAGGQHRVVPPQAVARLIEALPANARRRIFPPTVVVRRGHACWIRPSARWRGSIRWELFAQQKISEGESATPRIALPADLPLGTLDLRISFQSTLRDGENVTLLVVPERAYQGNDASSRMWALAVQLYGVRSRRNWGHGDFTDLANLIDLAAGLGAAGIGLNPLHDTFEASPYSPNSRLFLNPLYIDVEAIPGFPGLTVEIERDVEALRCRNLIDYPGVTRIKLQALQRAYNAFRTKATSTDRRDLARFREESGPTLRRFACFEVLRGRFGSPWWEWPTPWRRPTDDDLDRLPGEEVDRIGFFEFVQWQADRQLQSCRERARQAGMTLGLYLDIAVGVQPDGFDAWNDQGAMLPKVAIGAPPDMLNTLGQNWGLAAFHPLALEASRFELFRRVLRSSMRYAGAVRLDHVLGLQRLFLIPSGLPAAQGGYVRLPFESLLAVVVQESVRNRCIVIGEDLGTVPENFRETLADWGIWTYQIMLFQRASNGEFLPLESYSKNALVAFATHDLPAFAGWAEGHDLAVKTALGIDPGESQRQRGQAHRALHKALLERGLQAFEFTSVAQYLADTPARLLVIAIEDALGIKDQVNVPGTINEHPNWRRRLPVFLEDLGNQTVLVNLARAMRSAGRSIQAEG
jgi:4-alpha-glucanotransferase